jgi:hypothetical protein
MHRIHLIIYVLLTYLTFCSSQSLETRESVLAKAGNQFITEKEFIERYELLPNQFKNRSSNIEESKLLFLYSLVAEKLLTQEAETRHLDSSSLFQNAMAQVKKNLIRDQLYREQIREDVKVTPSEVQKAIIDAERKLFLSFFYFEDSTDAAFVRKQLKNCEQFNQLQIDTTFVSIRDTATLIWGEAEASVENAAFRLKKGECSPVIKASTGFYILYLNKEWPNSYFVSMEPNVLYERVETKIRLRKEKARLDEYIAKAFFNKTGFTLPKPFLIVSKALIEIWKNNVQSTEEMISDSLLEILSGHCKYILHDSMVVIGSSYWTVEDVLNKLRGKIFRIDNNRTTGLAVQLNNQLLVLVQQELLAEEGFARKLDERYSVKKELDIWRQQILAGMAEMDFKKHIQTSDQDIFRYLAEANPEMQYPRFKIRELHANNLAEMKHALSELQKGSSFEQVIRKYSSDHISAQNGGLSNAFPLNERVPLGMICWRMKQGEQSGPHRLKNDYIYFELISEEFPKGITDSSFSLMMQKTTLYAGKLKQKRSLDIFIAKSAQEKGYAIYADRLKMLKISQVPMMTFRILGFGGRMFAAPFVMPQVDWIDIENPESIPLP